MTFRKILCATDLSVGSRQALRTAARIAVLTTAELVIASAWFVPPGVIPGEYAFAPMALDGLVSDLDARLAEAAKEARDLGAPVVSTRVVHGVAWKEIVGLLERDAFDLCVTGTHGRSGLAHVMLGSVAELIVRHAPCPVLVVRPSNRPERYRRALVLIDFSEASRAALERAAELVPEKGGEIVLLHVVEPPPFFASTAQAQHLMPAYDKRTRDLLQAWIDELTTPTAATFSIRTTTGRPGTEILDTLAEPGWDLAVLGSHGRTGIAHLVLGLVAEKIVRAASCPVLVVHQPAAEVTLAAAS